MRRPLPLAAVRALYEVYDAVRVGRPADLDPVAEHDPALRSVLGMPPRGWPDGAEVLVAVNDFLNQPSRDGDDQPGDRT